MSPAQRKALEQALECLHDNRHYLIDRERREYLALYDKAIDDAEAALAEQADDARCRELLEAFDDAPEPAEQEPVAWRGYTITNGYTLHFHYGEAHRVASKIEPLYTAPRPANPAEQEPVAEIAVSPNAAGGVTALVLGVSLPVGTYKLYTAPQPANREPLTDEEIDELVRQRFGYITAWQGPFVRAIERAHGIGGQT